jgi:large conductance mechanosensitive channel
MRGFIDFIREQGVVGLAMGFIIGGSSSKLVNAFVTDIMSPILGLILGNMGKLSNYYLQIGSAKIMWGDFVTALIDFTILAFSVYFIFVVLQLNKLDKCNNVQAKSEES